MSEELKNKIHELDVLTDELSTLRPNAKVYARKVPSSKLYFLDEKTAIIDSKKKELAATKEELAAIPNTKQ